MSGTAVEDLYIIDTSFLHVKTDVTTPHHGEIHLLLCRRPRRVLLIMCSAVNVELRGTLLNREFDRVFPYPTINIVQYCSRGKTKQRVLALP